MTEEAAAPFLAPIPEEERFSTWHLVQRDGSLSGRGAGGLDLLELLVPRVGRGLRGLPLERPLDSAYELIARNRSRLGRIVPDKPGPRRFP
jgi:hypothetical protein